MIPDWAQQFFGGGLGLALGAAALFLAAAGAAYLAFSLMIRRRARTDSASHPPAPSAGVLRIARSQSALFLAALGAFLGFLLAAQSSHPALSFLVGREEWIFRAWLVSVVIQAFHIAAAVSETFLAWYLERVAKRTNTDLDDKLIPQIKRVARPAIYLAGGLTALGTVGVSITPLLAGLGIGGLAVALAVQPTLSNLFAGAYLSSEGDLNEGDFIEMDGGPAGFVVDVGWRATRVRDRFNNIILIPNSKLIESVVTNYQSQNAAVTVVVDCGVSYESDLARVERIALEVAHAARDDLDEAVDDFDPVVRFTAFGESNVDLVVVMQAADRLGSFAVKHEIIKRLHAAFGREGIEINYPVRKIIGSVGEEGDAPLTGEG